MKPEILILHNRVITYAGLYLKKLIETVVARKKRARNLVLCDV